MSNRNGGRVLLGAPAFPQRSDIIAMGADRPFTPDQRQALFEALQKMQLAADLIDCVLMASPAHEKDQLASVAMELRYASDLLRKRLG